MRRNTTYNYRISEKANKSLARRAVVVRTQKLLIVLAAIILISMLLLIGTSIHAFASSNNEAENKYYTSIVVEEGDTLWSIASKYNDSSKCDKRDYINEICSLNNISDNNIHTGDSIIICYYSSEHK